VKFSLQKAGQAFNDPTPTDNVWTRHAEWLSKMENIRYLEVRHLDIQTPADCEVWACQKYAYYIVMEEPNPEGHPYTHKRTPVGTIKADVDPHNLRASIGYMVDEHYQGMYAATEAIALMLDILRDNHITYVWAGVHASNTPSRAVLRKHDFEIVGEHRRALVGPYGVESQILYGRQL
jgi:RimJ/RimL family protein N-acetyltransferase